MDEFVNQTFLTNGSGYIRKTLFCKNQNFNFYAKIYEAQQKCLGQNYLSRKDIQTHFKLFSDRARSFRFNCKNVIKNEKFHFTKVFYYYIICQFYFITQKSHKIF